MGTVIGAVLKGRYQIEEKLGEGGVAEVFRAVDKRLGRTVVVKTLKRDLLDKPDVLERFTQEARDAASLSHPNIVQVFDAENDGNLHFIVMELCDGGDLRHLMDAGRLPMARILAVVHAMLNALAYAHEHGIVHRDIKPSNILLHGTGVKLGDFGIARALMSDTVTQQGTLIGSAGYLSPEQAQGFRVTATGDLYALGVVLYELLTGQRPFEANNPIALALKHVQEPPPSPRALRPDVVTERLEAVVLRALAKEPEQRFQSAQEFSEALAAATNAPGPPPFPPPPKTAQNLVPPPVNGRAPPPVGVPAAVPAATVATGRGFPWLLWGGLLCALVAGLVFGMNRWAGLVSVPNLIGQREQDARALLDQKGLKMRLLETRYENDVPTGTILSQDPSSGQERVGDVVSVIISRGSEQIDIPRIVGLAADRAQDAMESLGLKVQSSQEYSTTIPQGVVIRQSPESGSVAQLGSTVAMVVSKGPPPVAVPELVGKQEDVARKKLVDLGLQMEVESPQNSANIAKGCILTVQPGAGSMVPHGGVVQVVISLGPPVYTVPDLVGLSLGEARVKVRDAHLQLDLEGRAAAGDDELVASQTPAAGTQVTVPVMRVEIQPAASESPAESSTLGNPQNALTVPDVIGNDEAAARAEIAARGLTVASVEHQENPKPPGTVIEVSPSVGTAVEPGTGVTLTVSSGLPSSESP